MRIFCNDNAKMSLKDVANLSRRKAQMDFWLARLKIYLIQWVRPLRKWTPWHPEISPKISSEIGSPFQNLEISEVNVFSSSCEDSCFGLDFLWMVFLLGLLNIAIRSSRFIPRSLKIRN